MNVQAEIDKLRSIYGARPPGDAVLDVLERCENDEQRQQIEAAFVRETDNRARPEDGPQDQEPTG